MSSRLKLTPISRNARAGHSIIGWFGLEILSAKFAPLLSGALVSTFLAFLCFVSVSAAASEIGIVPGKGCDLFTESFKTGTAFKIRHWPGRERGAKLVSPKPEVVELVDQQVSIAASDSENTKLVLLNGAPVNLETTRKQELKQLGKALSFDASQLTKNQLDRIFDQMAESDAFRSWLILQSENNRLFRLDLSDETIQRSIFDLGFSNLSYLAGDILKFRALDKTKGQATVFQTSAPLGSSLSFKNYFELEYKLPFNLTLTSVPDASARGSLRVFDSVRSIERTSLKLALQHSNLPFSTATFRGCLAAIGDGLDGSQWTTINNMTASAVKAGSANLDIIIPSLENFDTPDFGDTVNAVFAGGHENARLLVMAATGSGPIFFGEAKHFIDDRKAAFWAGLVALLIAYFLPFIFIWRGRVQSAAASTKSEIRRLFALGSFHVGWRNSQIEGSDQSITLSPSPTNKWYSPLNLVRGRNGTASLSNLQIWWWSMAVFSLLIYVWVGTGSLASLNQTIMWLLGVTTGGSMAAKIVASRVNQEEQRVMALQNTREPIKTTVLDLIRAGDQVSLTKLQMLLFTIITGIYVVSTVGSQLVFPEIPMEMLTLMGISNGVYVLGKINNSNPHVEIATLHVLRQGLEDQLNAKKSRNTVIETRIKEIKGGVADNKLSDEQKLALEPMKAEQEEVKVDITKLGERIKEIDEKIVAAEKRTKGEAA